MENESVDLRCFIVNGIDMVRKDDMVAFLLALAAKNRGVRGSELLIHAATELSSVKKEGV